MNLRQLEAFRATIQTGSITGAASVLYISQPSVSRLIRDLEESVGFPLFMRSGRQVVPTVEARRFYQSVESMFIGINRLSELANTIRLTAGGAVSLGVIPSFTHVHMPTTVGELYNNQSEVQITLYTLNTPSILEGVRMQQFDFGIVAGNPPYEEVEVLYQTTVSYVCLIPESHALASETGHVDLEELVGKEDFAAYNGDYSNEILDMDQNLLSRLRQSSRLFFANMPLAASLVREAKVLAIVDPFTAEVAHKLGGVVSRPIKQDLKYHVAIVTKGLSSLSLAAREVADNLIERIKSA